ncbi:MAG: MFS transporter [Magnetococcales bacterium]|nr:MFS transporter [Magnetococcales bacterium]NGZ06026.1 MFS transporter [Magnetococcales bacterium]
MSTRTIPLTDAQKRHRWYALGVVATAYILSFFQRFAPAGIAHDLATDFQSSAAALGTLAATYFYIYTIMQVPTGMMVDTLGPRLILLIGGLVGGLGSILFGLAPSIDLALVGRTLIGLGVSVTFIAMLKIIAVWFEEHRFATLVGAVIVTGNLGSVLAGAPLSLMAQHSGWRGVFIGTGLLSLALSVACWLLVRNHPATIHHANTPVQPHPPSASVMNGLIIVLKNRATWPAALVNTGIAGSFFAFGGLWAMPFLTQVHGMSRTIASTHLSLYFAAFALGSLVIGTLSDRLQQRKPVILLSSHINAALWLIWLSGIPLASWASYPLFALMGLTTASFTLTWACAKEVNPPVFSGIATAVANMGGFLASALLQPVVGWVMDLHWQGGMLNDARLYTADEYRLGLMLLAASAWCGAACAWQLQETGGRNIWQPA